MLFRSGYKSLAQIPAHRNRPVSLYVRHQLWNSANFANSARRRRLASQIQPALRQVSEATLHSFQNYCVQCLSVHPHKSFPPALMHSPSITKRCCLTGRSTGPIAAGRHLGFKSLAQMPARRNGPVSSNVRHHRKIMLTASIRLDETPRLTSTIRDLNYLQRILAIVLYRLERLCLPKPCYRIAFTLSALLPNRALNRTYCGGPAFGL